MRDREYVPDYNDILREREARQERALLKLPICSCCEEHITDDHLFVIDGDLYCEECILEHFKKNTSDYIE